MLGTSEKFCHITSSFKLPLKSTNLDFQRYLVLLMLDLHTFPGQLCLEMGCCALWMYYFQGVCLFVSILFLCTLEIFLKSSSSLICYNCLTTDVLLYTLKERTICFLNRVRVI